MPFQSAGQHRPVGRAGLIQALEQAGCKCTAINNWLIQMQAPQGNAIQNAAPFAIAAAIEAIGVLETQERLGFAIAGLLAQIGPRVLTPMMPNESPRCEGEPVSRLLQPP